MWISQWDTVKLTGGAHMEIGTDGAWKHVLDSSLILTYFCAGDQTYFGLVALTFGGKQCIFTFICFIPIYSEIIMKKKFITEFLKFS